MRLFWELRTTGRCLEITDFSTSIGTEDAFDILHNKLGYWWLELNGVPIPWLGNLAVSPTMIFGVRIGVIDMDLTLHGNRTYLTKIYRWISI